MTRPALLTTDEVADVLRTTPVAVCRLVRVGELPARKVLRRWLVAQRDLDAWLEAQESNATVRALMSRPS